jgi:hypothetical protein
MSDPAESELLLYFPLWGASFDSDSVGIIGPRVVAYVPYAEEWRTIQKTEVWHAQWHSEGGKVAGPAPPCCIVASAPLGTDESMEEALHASGPALMTAARTAVTALRLYRAGWFLQPEQVIFVFSAPSLLPSIIRAPGPYRQIFSSGKLQVPPMPGYELKIADLMQLTGEPGPIGATWELLTAYQDTVDNTSVEIAIAGFNQSYGFQLLPPSRAANLFTALDAMLGGMSAWKIGRVAIKPRGYARRVEAALGYAETALADDPRTLGRWLHSEHGGRGLRNAISHGTGREVEAESERTHETLQGIVRALLRQYVHFATIWAQAREATAARLGIAAGSPLAAAYVTTLEAEACQPGAMSDLLCRPGHTVAGGSHA